jgi:hypothetical protein
MDLEQEFALFFGRDLPLKAIGAPGELLAKPGAERLSTNDWQEDVGKWIEQAHAVILRIEPTEGTWWEFLECCARLRSRPTRLLLLTDYFIASQQRYEELRRRVEGATDLFRLPPTLGGAMFVHFDEDWQPHLLRLKYHPWLVRSFVVSSLDLRASLRPFLEKLGLKGRREVEDTERPETGFR